MRVILPLFAAASLLTFASRGRSEFDGASGMASTKSKVTFENRPTQTGSLTVALQSIGLFTPPVLRVGTNRDCPTGKTRTPRTHRPANIPSLPYVEIGSYVY
jgi:hypothetical protein